MLKYILLCSLLAHTMWAKPLHQPHVLIVTPQAQLRLDSLVSGTPIIQHLSPFTRYIAPHEETIIYVPASAAAAIQNAEILSRSLEGNKGKQINPSDFASSFGTLAASGAQALQSAAQSAAESANTYITSSTTFVPTFPANNFQSTAEAFFQGAQSAISSLSQGQAPSPPQPPSPVHLLSVDTPLVATEVALPPIIPEQKQPLISTAHLASSPEQKLPLISMGTKISSLPPLLQPILPSISIITNEPRHHYVVAPSTPHIVDFLPGSILLSPATATTIKARRSILAEDKDAANPLPLPLPLAVSTPTVYDSKTDLKKEELLLIDDNKDPFKRFLEANALKEEIKEETKNSKDSKAKEDIKLPETEKDEKIISEKSSIELKLASDSANKSEDQTPLAKEI